MDNETELLGALLAGDRQRAGQVALRAFERGGAAHLYEDVVRPALEAVGELWRTNQISVADEHVATALAQTAMASLYPRFPWPAGGPTAIVACVEGEHHELGARMVADLLALDGWRDVFLGADTPLDALVAKAVASAPVLVALSATLPEHRLAVQQATARLRAVAPDVRLLVGGRAVHPREAQGLGADYAAGSAREAVDAVRSWKP